MDREGQTIKLVIYEKGSSKIPRFVFLNSLSKEFEIAPTSADSIDKYVIIIELLDSFQAKSFYYFIIDIQDPLSLIQTAITLDNSSDAKLKS